MIQNNRLADDYCSLTSPVVEKFLATAKAHARLADLDSAAEGGARPRTRAATRALS